MPGVDVDDYVVKYKSGKIFQVCSNIILLGMSYNFASFLTSFVAALDLIEHLRAMGETNALLQRNKVSFFVYRFCGCDHLPFYQVYCMFLAIHELQKQILKRETALATAAIYDSMFATEDGTVPATFQVCV